MTDDQSGSKTPPTDNPSVPATSNAPTPAKFGLVPLPGLIALSLYLLLLSLALIVGAVGGHYPKLFLILPVFLLAAAGGLLLLFRWAWAMALAAVVLLSGYHLWLFARLHLAPSLIQGLLNLVFFLYLIRTEVRDKLR